MGVDALEKVGVEEEEGVKEELANLWVILANPPNRVHDLERGW